MTTPESEDRGARSRKTWLLLAGGLASLVLPLLGIAYLRFVDAGPVKGPGSSSVFDRREDAASKVVAAQAVVVAPRGSAAPTASGSSLDFVKAEEIYQEKPAAAAPSAAPAAPAETDSRPIEAKAKPASKYGQKKAFASPKLQGSKFSSFSPRPTGGQGISGAADPKAGKPSGDMADLLKNIPGGADNPEYQKLLKSRGR